MLTLTVALAGRKKPREARFLKRADACSALQLEAATFGQFDIQNAVAASSALPGYNEALHEHTPCAGWTHDEFCPRAYSFSPIPAD